MINGINTITVSGRLVRDSEMRVTNSGKELLTARIAVNRRYKKAGEYTEETCFLDITLFGDYATKMQPFMVKGKGLSVVGSLRQYTKEKEGHEPKDCYSIAVDKVYLDTDETRNKESLGSKAANYYGGDNQTDRAPF